MTVDRSRGTERLIEEWVARPENTARTVLVTIFGDTIQPVASSVWLAQLFRLTDVLGFSERLVRTSMTRLVREGWLDNERVGRQSRYLLTDSALDETVQAGRRIYHEPSVDWSGDWSVVFLGAPSLDPEVRARLATHLRWHGFIPIGHGVLASPTIAPTRTNDLVRAVVADAGVPTGTLRFADLDAVVADGFFDAELALGDLTTAYDEFLAFHRRVEEITDGVDGPVAFGLRTMLIHDLRRIRLRSVDLPTALLPPDWSGTAAHDLAKRLNSTLSSAAAAWLTEVLGVAYPAQHPDRFERAPV